MTNQAHSFASFSALLREALGDRLDASATTFPEMMVLGAMGDPATLAPALGAS